MFKIELFYFFNLNSSRIMPNPCEIRSIGKRARKIRARHIANAESRRLRPFSDFHEVNRARALKLSAAFDEINELTLAYIEICIDVDTGTIYFQYGNQEDDDFSSDFIFVHFFPKRLMWLLLKEPILEASIEDRPTRNMPRSYDIILTVNGMSVNFVSRCTKHSDGVSNCKRLSIYGPVKHCRNYRGFPSVIYNGLLFPGLSIYMYRLCRVNEDIYFNMCYRGIGKIKGITHTFDRKDPMLADLSSKHVIVAIPDEVIYNEFNQMVLHIRSIQDKYTLTNSAPYNSFSYDPTSEFCISITFKTGRTSHYRVIYCYDSMRRAFLANDTERIELNGDRFDGNIEEFRTRTLTNKDGPLTRISEPERLYYICPLNDPEKTYARDTEIRFSDVDDVRLNYYRDVNGNNFVAEITSIAPNRRLQKISNQFFVLCYAGYTETNGRRTKALTHSKSEDE